MFRRAAREPRVVAGLALIAAAAAVGLFEYHDIRAQADRNYAHCVELPLPADCRPERKPVTVVTTRSSGNGFRKDYSLVVQTGSHTTLTIGVSGSAASHFENQSSADVRYRAGHPAAIVADDGTTLEVPFIFSLHVAAIAGIAIALGLLGAGSLAWGFTRVNRNPKTA